MKHIANVRLPVLLVLALVTGAFIGYVLIRIGVSLFYIISIVPVIAVICLICVRFSNMKVLVFGVTAMIMMTVGITNTYLRLEAFSDKAVTGGDVYSVSATVCEKGKNGGDEYIIVKDISFNGMETGGKMKVYLSSAYGDFCDVGYHVAFEAKVYCYDTFPYGSLSYNAIKNIKYNCNVYGGLTSQRRFSLFGSVNSAVRKILYNSVDANTAAITLAMLTGNTEGIEEGSLTAFRYGGIAHVFAVSGLHIGLVYGILSFLCRKLRLNRYVGFAVCILPLIFYSGVCGFTVSSVRALIMCTVYALSKLFFEKYDALNSLSLAVILILFIQPLNLFNTGFQLSVGAVCGITFLSKSLLRPFKRIPRRLKSPVCISLSAQAGTMPVLLAKFGYLSGAGILLNIVIIPVISGLYEIAFITVLLCLILPFLAQFLLPITLLPLEFIISFFVDIGFEKSLISGFGAGLFLPVYYLGMFAFTDKLNLKMRYRLISFGCALAFICTYIPINTFAPFNGHKIVVSAYYGGGEVLFKSDEGNVLVITENLNLSRTDSLLNEYYAGKPDALIILGGENCAARYGDTHYGCPAYVYGEYIPIQPYTDKEIIYTKDFSLCGIDFEFMDGYSLYSRCDGLDIGICAGRYVPERHYDYLFTDNYEFKADNKVSFNERNCDYCVYNDGNYILKTK